MEKKFIGLIGNCASPTPPEAASCAPPTVCRFPSPPSRRAKAPLSPRCRAVAAGRRDGGREGSGVGGRKRSRFLLSDLLVGSGTPTRTRRSDYVAPASGRLCCVLC